MKIPKIPRWVWVALKRHLDISKGVYPTAASTSSSNYKAGDKDNK